jgi:hypothetical protein
MSKPVYPPAPGESDVLQLAFIPQDPPPPASAKRAKRQPAYLWFTAKFPRDIAIGIFVKKHRCTPTRVDVEGKYLKVGPVPEATV